MTNILEWVTVNVFGHGRGPTKDIIGSRELNCLKCRESLFHKDFFIFVYYKMSAQTQQHLLAQSYVTYTRENELTLLKQIIGVFTLRNRQLDEQDESKPTEYTHMPYLDDQKFILLVSMIFTARDIFGSEYVFKKFPAGQQFFRTLNYKDKDTELNNSILFMNTTPKANAYIKNKTENTHFELLITNKPLIFADLTILSLLFGISIKSGKYDAGTNSQRGLFDIFSYPNIIRVCQALQIHGLILFDTADAFPLRKEEEHEVINNEVMEDITQKRAIPLVQKHEKGVEFSINGACYPEFILVNPNKGQPVSDLIIRQPVSYSSGEIMEISPIERYLNPEIRKTNFAPQLQFHYSDDSPNFLDAIKKRYDVFINASRGINGLYVFPYAYSPADNYSMLSQFIQQFTLIRGDTSLLYDNKSEKDSDVEYNLEEIEKIITSVVVRSNVEPKKQQKLIDSIMGIIIHKVRDEFIMSLAEVQVREAIKQVMEDQGYSGGGFIQFNNPTNKRSNKISRKFKNKRGKKTNKKRQKRFTKKLSIRKKV